MPVQPTALRPGHAARRAAHALLLQVWGEGRRLSDVSDGILAPLAPEDRARAQRLAAGALREADRADRVLGPYLRRMPDAPAMAALRLGAWEILSDGAPAHAVVDAMAGVVAAGPGGKSQAGLVNAVLRRVGSAPVDWSALPPPRLPKTLRKVLVGHWGKDRTAAMETAQALGAPVDLTPRDGDAAALAGATGGTVLPTGSVRLTAAGQVSALPGYAEGRFWVQDAAAALPARMLAAAPGERVLDLCAAPGGKTLQLAATGASVTALDLSEARLVRLRENLARTGLGAEIVAADALEWTPERPFDAILLDAPCSATGTIRRHPDLPHVFDPTAVAALVALQSALIDRALGWLAPGGRLVYCVCSILPDEGEAQLSAALARHPDLTVDRVPLPDGLSTGDGALRSLPSDWADLGGIDGFHAVRLSRIGETGRDGLAAVGGEAGSGGPNPR